MRASTACNLMFNIVKRPLTGATKKIKSLDQIPLTMTWTLFLSSTLMPNGSVKKRLQTS